MSSFTTELRFRYPHPLPIKAADRIDELETAIRDFRIQAGKHVGDHDQDGGIHCSKCVASYNVAEDVLDMVLAKVSTEEV